jgi:DNA invertase Pin-like site-specific DNA recombinase
LVFLLSSVKVFTEDISGVTDTFERPVFIDMVNDILSNGVDLIVVEDLSRLAIDHHIQDHFISYLGNKQIDLITVDTGTNVIQSAKDDDMLGALIQIQATFNELEKKRLVRRLQRGRQITGKKGGRPSYYPKELKKRIRILRSKGNSYGAIADRFNLEDIKTSTKRPWTAQLVRVVGMAEAEQTTYKRIPRSRTRKEGGRIDKLSSLT